MFSLSKVLILFGLLILSDAASVIHKKQDTRAELYNEIHDGLDHYESSGDEIGNDGVQDTWDDEEKEIATETSESPSKWNEHDENQALSSFFNAFIEDLEHFSVPDDWNSTDIDRNDNDHMITIHHRITDHQNGNMVTKQGITTIPYSSLSPLITKMSDNLPSMESFLDIIPSIFLPFLAVFFLPAILMMTTFVPMILIMVFLVGGLLFAMPMMGFGMFAMDGLFEMIDWGIETFDETMVSSLERIEEEDVDYVLSDDKDYLEEYVTDAVTEMPTTTTTKPIFDVINTEIVNVPRYFSKYFW
jgi:uncharacterized membrane protein YqaE (UPF0057 family)